MFNLALRRHPAEASLIGQLVLGYGELERAVAVLLGASIGDRRPAFRMMFSMLGETARIDAANAMMQHKYDQVGLTSEYADAIGAVKFRVKARNQFAHCHWADDVYAGLIFANFRETVKSKDSTEHVWLHIDKVITEDLLLYFEYTINLLQFLEKEYLVRTGKAAYPPWRSQGSASGQLCTIHWSNTSLRGYAKTNNKIKLRGAARLNSLADQALGLVERAGRVLVAAPVDQSEIGGESKQEAQSFDCQVCPAQILGAILA